MAEGGTDGNGDGGPPKSPDLTNKQNEDDHTANDDNMDTPKDDDATGPKVAAVNYQDIPLSPLKQKPLHNERPKRQTVATATARAQIPEPQMDEMIRGLR